MQDFYKSFLETAKNADILIMSDELCCQILAFVYAFGGGNEKIVFDLKIKTEILHAQERLNIYGGETPKAELFEMLQKYLKEVNQFIDVHNVHKTQEYTEHPKWVLDIFKRWNLTVVKPTQE